MSVTTTGKTLRERQRQEREDLILLAAEELFLEKGVNEASIDDIAARVGIAKGTIYLHFASKEGLVFALHQRDVQQFLHEMDDILASSASATVRLRAIIDRVYGGMLGRRFQILTAVYQNPEFRARFAEKRSELHVTWEDIAQRIRTVLEDGKAAGEFDPAIPTSVMLSFFLSMLSPRSLFLGMYSPQSHSGLVAHNGMTPEEIVEQLSRCFFKGIAPDRPPLHEDRPIDNQPAPDGERIDIGPGTDPSDESRQDRLREEEEEI